jgi:hypothetical protein
MIKPFPSLVEDCSVKTLLLRVPELSHSMLISSVVHFNLLFKELSADILVHDSLESASPEHVLEPLLNDVTSMSFDLRVSRADFLCVRSHTRPVLFQHWGDHVALLIAHKVC